MINDETLIELFEYALPSSERVANGKEKPTKESIEEIEGKLKIQIPEEYVMIAKRCSGYRKWFAHIGEDYDNPFHIIQLNKYLHDEGLPDNFVIFNHGYDLDFDCWDLQLFSPNKQNPIVCFNFQYNNPIKITLCFSSFRDYLEYFCCYHAPRSSSRSFRRKAKKLLSELGLYC